MRRTHRDLDNTKDGKRIWKYFFGSISRAKLEIDFVDRRIDRPSKRTNNRWQIVSVRQLFCHTKDIYASIAHVNLLPIDFSAGIKSKLFKYMESRRKACAQRPSTTRCRPAEISRPITHRMNENGLRNWMTRSTHLNRRNVYAFNGRRVLRFHLRFGNIHTWWRRRRPSIQVTVDSIQQEQIEM